MIKSIDLLNKVLEIILLIEKTKGDPEFVSEWKAEIMRISNILDENVENDNIININAESAIINVYESIKSKISEFVEAINENDKVVEFNALSTKYRELVASKPKSPSARSYEVCEDCDVILTSNGFNSSLICNSCGFTTINNIMEPEQAPLVKTVNNVASAPSRVQTHLDEWLKAIQGQGLEDIPPKLVSMIGDLIDVNSDIIINVQLIRGYMSKINSENKDLKFRVNVYYKYAPALVYHFRNQTPLSFTDKELSRFYQYFGQVYKVFIDNGKTGNFSYFPYFIYKMIEALFTDVKRRKYFMSMILLQTTTTNEKNDKTWRVICKTLGITYKCTTV